VLNPLQQQRLGVMLGLVADDAGGGVHTVGP
jgi:hypothetical protein